MGIKSNFDPIIPNRRYTDQKYRKKANRNALQSQNYTRIPIGDSYSKSEAYCSYGDDYIALRNPGLYVKKYINQNTIQNAIDTNPNIAKILEENNLPVEFNMDNITSIIDSHLIPVSKCVQRIYKNMGHDEDEILYTRLTQAALLHDIGKVFIPSKILNKKGKLTPEERRIVELHNVLGYEILKTIDIPESIAKLALEHHDYDGVIVKTKENQALMVADIYCALREKRPYKKQNSHTATILIMYKMALGGKFNPKYLNHIK